MKNKTRNQELVAVKFIGRREEGIGVLEILTPTFKGEVHAEVLNVVDDLTGELGKIRFIVLDLTKIESIDSEGVGILASVYKRLETKGVEIGFTGYCQKLKDLLKRTHLDTLFQCYQSAKQGVQEFLIRQVEKETTT